MAEAETGLRAFWLIARFGRGLGMAWVLAYLLTAAAGAGEFSDLKGDEEVVLFPAIGYLPAGATNWVADVRGCVFEPEKRAVALTMLTAALRVHGLRPTPEEQALMGERARLFMTDNERGKRIVVRAGGRVFSLGKSGRDGIFSGVIHFPLSRADGKGGQAGGLGEEVEVLLPPGDARRFCGTAWRVPPRGVTVVSDIDDTIKKTSVWDRRAMLRNTFLEPFVPVPGMADLYSSWSTNSGTFFCYVSASPWQLYFPLSEFVRSKGFPDGFFSLKQVRWKDRTLLDLFADPEQHKLAAIEPLLRRFPERQFVLVGDSGERDPEIYATLARRYPGQVARILIRDAAVESAGLERYQQAFKGIPGERWRVFRDPAEIGKQMAEVWP